VHTAAIDAAKQLGATRGHAAGPEVRDRLDAARPRLNVTAIAEGASLQRSMDDWAIAATLHAEEIVKAAPDPQDVAPPAASSDAWSTVGTAVADLAATVGSLASEVQGAPADLQDVTAARAEFAQRAKPWAQWAAVLPAYTQVADAARARLESKTGVGASLDAIMASGLARGPTPQPLVFPLQALQDQVSQLEAKEAVGEERDAAAAAAVKQLAAELNSPGPDLAAAVKAAQAAQVGPPAPDRDLANAMLQYIAQQGAFAAPPRGAVESAERRGELTALAHVAEFLQRRVPAPTPAPTPAPSPAAPPPAPPLEFRGARAVAAPGHAPAPQSYGASQVHVTPDLDLVLDFSGPLHECSSPDPRACVLTISPTAASGQQPQTLSVKDTTQVTVKGRMLRVKPTAPFPPGQYTLSVPGEAVGSTGPVVKLEFYVDGPPTASPSPPPTECKMSPWSSWSGCHLVGGQHVERRQRVVFAGAPDCAPTEETRPCSLGQATPAPAAQASPSPAAQAVPATTPIPLR